MDLKLTGKVAMVGGASKGLGYAVARALAGEGARVSIASRDREAIDRAAAAIKNETGATVLASAADLSAASGVEAWHRATMDAFGGVDALYANTGGPPAGAALTFDDTAWRIGFDLLVLSVIRAARLVVPSMQARGGGSILNITAISAIQPIPGFALSVATWSAVIGYAKTLSLEVAPFGINVNTICPGYIDTSRLQKVFASGSEGADVVQARLTDEIPMKRIGTTEDIASLVALLVSPRGRYITGTAIQVDGGLLRAVR
jgi:3-oxoacyl-[acyl-carrier protein] reductase